MKKNYPILLCFIFLNYLFSFSQIINNGSLKIETGTTVLFLNQYTNSITGSHICNGNLYLNDNFINDGITNSSSGTTYVKSAINDLITISGLTNNINCYNFEIDITAPSTKGVTVVDNFALNVNNSLHIKNGDLRLIGDAQLIQTHTGSNINTVGSGKLLRDQSGYSSAYQYNYWSSPVNNGGTFSLLGGTFDGTDSSINPYTPQQILFNSGSPYNGLPSTLDGSNNVVTPLTINTTWLYKYSRGDTSYSDWISLNQSSVLNPGEGYIMKGTNTILPSQNYVYYGVPNNGDYTFPILIGESSLLGNPYPSALDATKFIQDNISVVDALYFWVDGGSNSHNLTDYLGGYAIRNLTGGTPPSIASPLISGIGTSGTVTAPKQYVPIGQGFFIEAIGSGNIIFNNSQRIFKTEGLGESVFYRNSSNTESENQYIRLGFEDPEGFHRQLLLGFLDNSPADIGYNPGYDAFIANLRDDDMYFIIENDINNKYAIQGVGSFLDTMEFPIGLTISENGAYQILLDEVENFTNTIFLRDNYLNTYHNLNDSQYYVNLSIGEYNDRFSIVFNLPETLSETSPSLNKTNVYYDGLGHIIVANVKDIDLQSISVYDIIGKNIITIKNNIKNKERIEIPFDKSNGVYLVILKTNNIHKSTKILKY